MVYSEISITVAKTLWYFDFRRATGSLGEIGAGSPGAGQGREQRGEFQLFDNFTASHDGPCLVFKCRENIYEDLDNIKFNEG